MNKQTLNQKAKRDSHPLSRNTCIIRALYNSYDMFVCNLYYMTDDIIDIGKYSDSVRNLYKIELHYIKNKYRISARELHEFNRIAIDHWHERNTI